MTYNQAISGHPNETTHFFNELLHFSLKKRLTNQILFILAKKIGMLAT